MSTPISSIEKAELHDKRRALFEIWSDGADTEPKTQAQNLPDDIRALILTFTNVNADRMFLEHLYPA